MRKPFDNSPANYQGPVLNARAQEIMSSPDFDMRLMKMLISAVKHRYERSYAVCMMALDHERDEAQEVCRRMCAVALAMADEQTSQANESAEEDRRAS